MAPQRKKRKKEGKVDVTHYPWQIFKHGASGLLTETESQLYLVLFYSIMFKSLS